MEIFVSDHAVLRYVQRVLGIDTEAIRAEIRLAVENGVELGASGVRKGNTTYKLTGQTVVTVLEKGSTLRKRRSRIWMEEDWQHGR